MGDVTEEAREDDVEAALSYAETLAKQVRLSDSGRHLVTLAARLLVVLKELDEAREAALVIAADKRETLGLWEAAKADLLRAEEALRREWWMNHGHPYPALYGDDGEMQCQACPCDFKREPIGELKERVFAARLARAALSPEGQPPEMTENTRSFLDWRTGRSDMRAVDLEGAAPPPEQEEGASCDR